MSRPVCAQCGELYSPDDPCACVATEAPAKPVIDEAILESPILWTAVMTLGMVSVAFVVGGRPAADHTAILVPGVALVLAAGRRLAHTWEGRK